MKLHDEDPFYSAPPETLGMRLTVAAIVGIVAALIYLMVFTPVVTRDWVTGQCLAVEPAEAGNCDNLPDRYEVHWERRP